MAKCMQVKIFHDEHNCCVRFRNKMVNVKVLTEHFEATIRDHQKMKLREIQRRVALEMHVNVNMTRCRRAKKMVKDKLVHLRVKCWLLLGKMETIRCTQLPVLLLKGLKIAINDILPKVEHRNYARQVLSNWSGRKKAKTFEFAFWKVVKSTTERDGNKTKKTCISLMEVLQRKNSKAWTKAFQGLYSVSNIVDNNLCEAFNSNIVESRFNSIITMLVEIRVNVMIKIVAKRK
ncbi:hypothetical protein PVK06_040356 [Gossypium arboreum]|uniref:Uncharacterized protein n=1 Tax=Gossypium arboreum TaxID=29729 RepID=A0ABR0N5V0_GOSAR|nr:hypothetical protein PVK06_040356 [Gossypium arboreum]